jgi:DNA polymerase I-like protein with 3'-5' exonuclease and polymerase domains
MAWGFTDIAARYIKAPKTPWNGGLRLVFDLEADALLDAATTVHCICIADLDSDTTAEYGPDQNQISAALEHLARAAALVAHNGQAYDLPVLAKLYGWAPPAGCVVRDTLILARLIFPAVGDLDDIVTGIAKARGGTGIGQLRGRHSIEAWGQRLNLAKVGADLEDFSAWSQELQDRCAADVQICKALWQFLKPDGYSRYAIELEHRAAEVCEAIAAAGVPFDSAGAQRLTDRLRVRRAELRGPLRAQFPGVNLNSNQQLVPLFESRGWKPSKRTEKTGQPKLGDEVLTSIATLYPEFAGLAEYLKLGRLLAFLQTGAAALCKHVGTDRRVRGAIMPLGTPHSRAAHLHPNLAATPNPKKGAAFGAECRSLFRAPPGWVCVAADQSGLQDRGLASYLHPHDGGAYAASFAEGADTHWRSAIALGLVSEGTARDKASAIHTALREGAKRFRYAFLYGVGAEKAGTIIFETCRGVHNAAPEVMARFFAGTATPGESALKRVGRQAIDRFVASTPGLAELRTKLIAHQGKHHWLPGLDGRRVPVRAQHVALNYLITSSEAVITKRWLVRVYDELCERFKYGWDGDVVLALWVHDELVAYAKAKLADQVGEILVRHAREPATFYSFKAPLDADYVVAPSWAGELTMEVEGPPPGTVVLPDEEPTRAKKPRKKKRADAQSELPLDAPAKPQPRTWREDIAAINEAMVAQGVDAAPLSEAVAAFMDPPPEPAPTPKPIKPNGTTASKANGTTPPPPPPDPPSDGGSRSGDPSSVGEGKLYERIHSALRGRGYVRAASFTYRLPDGTVLFTEDRWELRSAFAPTADRPRKEYRYWHVGPKGVAYSGTGPRRIVYNWPAILTAGPGAQVLVVEGAYKAAPLIAAGLLATAAPLHQWSSECVEALAGRHLAYLPDHDHPDANGKRSSERLAADARAKLVPRAASFKIVPARTLWEDLGSAGEPPHGYDVRDWIEAGGTAARLVAICAAIPDGRAGSRLVMVKASSVVARAVPWMWPGHLERGALELLAGAPGLGKSQVQIHYVACATTSRNWPDGAKGGAPRDAIMLTAEDQLASAMVPRLIAAAPISSASTSCRRSGATPRPTRCFCSVRTSRSLRPTCAITPRLASSASIRSRPSSGTPRASTRTARPMYARSWARSRMPPSAPASCSAP